MTPKKHKFSTAAIVVSSLLCLVNGRLATRCTAAVSAGSIEASAVNGAEVAEGAIRTTITVEPATLRVGFLKAQRYLADGISTKIVMRPGTYRESLADLTWTSGKTRDTVLVIEGTPGRTLWDGADPFPISTWNASPDGLLVHAWPYHFGNLGNFWAPKGDIAFRREMAYVDGTALRPEVLETYKIDGLSYTSSLGPTYEYRGFRNPESALKPGDFGVVERKENGGGRIYVRLPTGTNPAKAQIEVSVRSILLNFGNKRNLVIRGLNFIRCANPMPDADYKTPGFASGAPVAFDVGAGNILIDRCAFLWNSGTALAIVGTAWTVRNSVFNYNGLSGISTAGACNDILFDGNETSFNCWRSWRAGENDWSYGGIKMHTTDMQCVVHHLALANCSTGMWWDVSCARVDVADSVSLANACSDLKYEFSYGPFRGRRLVLAGSKWGPTYICTTCGSGTLENSVLYKDYAMDHDKTPASVASLLSYRRADEPKNPPVDRSIYSLIDDVVVAGPRTPLVLTDEAWDDPKDDAVNWSGSSSMFKSDLVGNVYWAVNHSPAFDVHASNNGILNRAADFDVFAKETADNSRLVDPSFVDPPDYDFRFAAQSPLYNERFRWPQYCLPAARLKEMRAFFTWLGCGAAGPGAPPGDDPNLP